ncbi:DUF2911 domain-containing protein [Chitinophaga sp. SYP-B3965]|uniref:DUF2911 domain-containing protein n=1 Tax=Chitinophaga sp. SYP-B3965 TaxID=2663120 RepID=UPI001299DCAE|nr:DUF2911 domain-containing protein [Chitinophaga sp. SYP-B3965]MRG44281.1 DUF2911 domain-containing protein [Chitinophaga sp. SYP-B3965]
MKKLTLITICLTWCVTTLFAQSSLNIPHQGGNKKASVSERIGLTEITIQYDRPGVKGREGKVWGQLVHVGFVNPGFGSSKSAPWRAGANENTTIEFTSDVKIEGQPLAKGKYGFFIAYGPEESTLIFSKNASSWGHYFYDEKEDVLRVKVKPVALDKSVEWLKYEFLNETDNSATIGLEWEKLMIPFKVEVNLVEDQLASIRKELRSEKGFMWESWNHAAQYCLEHNTNLNEALLWADTATGSNFGGEKSFAAWSTKAMVLSKLGQEGQAAEIMKKALPLGSMNDIHQYGRQLLGQKKSKEALEVFKMNAAAHPNDYTTLMGLTRGYSGVGDYKNALKFATQAMAAAPGADAQKQLQQHITKLKEGKDIN